MSTQSLAVAATEMDFGTLPLYQQGETTFNAPMPLVPETKQYDKSKPLAANSSFNDLLVAVGKKRDRDAFIRLFEYYAPRVKSFVMKGGISPDQADEIAQETMLTVWHRAAQFNPVKASAGTWIFTIARNKRIDVLRKKSWVGHDNGETPDVADETQERADDALGRAEEEKTIAGALAELPAEQADILRKAFFEDKTHAAIAAETNLPLGTVKSRIRLAMDRLRGKLEGNQP